MDWISVDDRLPEDGVSVMVWNKDDVEFGFMHEGVLRDYTEIFRHATHWMPKPKRPEEQAVEKPVMDKNLEALLDFINGKIFPFTKGIFTHVEMDENQTKIHNDLLKLEKLGKVKRHYETEHLICWMPV